MRIPFDKVLAFVACAVLAVAVIPSCSGAVADAGTDSNTHWLDPCAHDAECGPLDCLCGVCTTACDGDGDCANFGTRASCGSRDGCSAGVTAVCIARCSSNDDCPMGLACEGGQCVSPPRDGGGGGSCAPMDARSDGTRCASIAGYAWDGTTCTPIYCGCAGTECGDIFPTADACDRGYSACYAERGISRSCSADADCALVDRGCCSPCGMPALDQMVAVSTSSITKYREQVCAGGDGCPACAGSPNPSLVAACVAGQCTAGEIGPGATDAGATFDPATCSLPADSGPCFGAGTRYAYDPLKASCVPFTYGLCGGNANNFESKEACDLACAERADGCSSCPDGACPELPVSCSICPVTRYGENGAVCTAEGFTCVYLPACGAVTCTCAVDATGGLRWECIGNLC